MGNWTFTGPGTVEIPMPYNATGFRAMFSLEPSFGRAKMTLDGGNLTYETVFTGSASNAILNGRVTPYNSTTGRFQYHYDGTGCHMTSLKATFESVGHYPLLELGMVAFEPELDEAGLDLGEPWSPTCDGYWEGASRVPVDDVITDSALVQAG